MPWSVTITEGLRMESKIILTDVDGVLLDWHSKFNTWMNAQGYQELPGSSSVYSVGPRYGITKEQGKELTKTFNRSAAIGFLKPLRDSLFYVGQLHHYGYKFHCITSLSTDPDAQELRKMNLRRLFGDTVFEKFIILGTGDDKDQALAPYVDSQYYWIEDKISNARTGHDMGLKSILMGHSYNKDHDDPAIPRVKCWREIFEQITGTAI